MDRDSSFQKKVRETGLEIYSAMTGIPAAFDKRSWTGRMMGWSMANDEFRTALFRFIDVLPALGSDDMLIRLLKEYFGEVRDLPALLRGGIARMSRTGFLPHVTARMVRRGAESVARQFIAGKDAADGLPRFRALGEDGALFSIDLLGEVVVSDREAADYAAKYMDLLGYLRSNFGEDSRAEISIKVSSFYSQLEPVDWEGSLRRTKEGLAPVLRRAKELGIAVTFDMEHYYYKGLIVALFKSIFAEDEFRDISSSIALQAYLKDTENDISDLLKWAREKRRKIGIRLVKGAYWDYETVVNRQKGWPVPVFLNKAETDANFERLTRLLLSNVSVVRPAIATHNLRSISHALALAESMKIANDDFEFQMLYGMAEPLRKAMLARGATMRIYTPLGDLIPGMAYLVRRLLENTSNTSFLRRSFGEGASFDELMKPPGPQGKALHGPGASDGFRNEPATDFSVAANRKAMKAALEGARQRMNSRYPLLIGGRETASVKEIVSVNPSQPQEIVGRVSSASVKEAEAAVGEALKASHLWQRTPPQERASYLFRTAEGIRKKRFDLAALEVYEVGKTWQEADGDVAEAIDYLEYYGREMLRLGAPSTLGDYPGEENGYFYRPRGVGVVISPWNFPLAIACGMTSAAIVTGNCVIFKPSGLSPVTGYRLAEIFGLSGLPPGVLQFLPGPGKEVGEYLVSHPATDFVAFTGSRDVGLKIVKVAAETTAGQRNIRKVIAEMGGKNALIVDETADLDEAVRGILESALGFQGQKCSACSRVIVIGDIYEDLCRRLGEAFDSVRIGPPEDPGNFMGPLIDEEAAKKIRNYVEIGRNEAVAMIEKKVVGSGYFAGPVVFLEAARDARISTEEIFGPVLSITRAEDIDEALNTANDSLYALTGGIYSRSPSNILKVTNELRAGSIYINRKITGALVGRQPFGGFGMSGVGSKAGGPDYLLQFMNPVSVSENTLRRGFAPQRKKSERKQGELP